MLTHFKMEELETLKCNISLMSQQNEASIPEKCYLRMKWRKSINHKTLEDNRKSLTSFGKNQHWTSQISFIQSLLLPLINYLNYFRCGQL